MFVRGSVNLCTYPTPCRHLPFTIPQWAVSSDHATEITMQSHTLFLHKQSEHMLQFQVISFAWEFFSLRIKGISLTQDWAPPIHRLNLISKRDEDDKCSILAHLPLFLTELVPSWFSSAGFVALPYSGCYLSLEQCFVNARNDSSARLFIEVGDPSNRCTPHPLC